MISTRTGFAGGRTDVPTYQQVCTKKTGHAETVEVTYDLRVLSTRQLLTEFFALHDSTIDRSGGGGQYRSAIFIMSGQPLAEQQEKEVRRILNRLRAHGVASTTKINRIQAFFAASDRHQQYCAARGIEPGKRDFAYVRQILTL